MKNIPTKITKRERVRDFELSNSIDDIIADLSSLKKELKANGYSNATIERHYYGNYDGYGYELEIYADRLETDEEYLNRLNLAKMIADNKKKAANSQHLFCLKTFLKLKKKFEK